MKMLTRPFSSSVHSTFSLTEVVSTCKHATGEVISAFGTYGDGSAAGPGLFLVLRQIGAREYLLSHPPKKARRLREDPEEGSKTKGRHPEEGPTIKGIPPEEAQKIKGIPPEEAQKIKGRHPEEGPKTKGRPHEEGPKIKGRPRRSPED